MLIINNPQRPGHKKNASVYSTTCGFMSWGTRTRTKNDRTRICSVTITPYPNNVEHFSNAGAKVLLFYKLPKLLGENL